jgi:serine/threonine protein kinase
MVSAAPPPASTEAASHLHPDTPSALPVGARIAEFEIRGVLGSGGFGIVYLAWDQALEREVALKEYMPGTLAGRGGDMSVSVRSQSMAETFALGLRSFVNEARMLARFDHPSLVKVYRFWEDNGTAYMVMPYYKGRTLRKVRAGMVLAPGEGACRKVLDALLSALEVLHKEGVFHRDIAPDNILIGDDGEPVLLDFGAARPGTVMRPSSTSRSMCTLCGRSGGFRASIQSIAARKPAPQSRGRSSARRGWSSCSAREAAATGSLPVSRKYIVPPRA